MTIAMEINLGKDEFENFGEIEKSVYGAAMEAGREVLRRILAGLDEELLRERDGKEYRNKGKRKTCIKTLLGEVEYSRRVYEHAGKNGEREYRYLLDEVLGKETVGCVSMTICQLAVESAAESTYRSASRQLSEMTGLRLSHQAVWGIVQKMGEKRRAEVKEQSRQVEQQQTQGTLVSKILYEEADGVWLKLQGKDRKKRGAKAEMKVAIAYDGALWSPGKKRRTLDNKVAYASFEEPRTFVSRKEGVIASHYNTAEIELRVLNGDGGSWIKSLQDPKGLFVLDEFHRNKAITEKVDDPDLRKTMRSLLYSGKIEDLLLCIEASIESTLDPGEQDRRRELLSYFTVNKDGLKGCYDRGVEIPETRAENIHHARLGSMESNIFTVIVNRMKGRRACWSIHGAENLALLLCLKHTTGYGHLLSRIKSGEECITQEEYQRPLSARKIPEISGKGYESPLRKSLAPGWAKKVFAPCFASWNALTI